MSVITTQTLQQNGISSPEQLTMYLSANGTGADNLAANGGAVQWGPVAATPKFRAYGMYFALVIGAWWY